MVNIDVTVYLDGFHGDCSEMFMVGEVGEKFELPHRYIHACACTPPHSSRLNTLLSRHLTYASILLTLLPCLMLSFSLTSSLYFLQVDERGQELVQVTYESWIKAMDFCEPGRSYKDIGAIMR